MLFLILILKLALRARNGKVFNKKKTKRNRQTITTVRMNEHLMSIQARILGWACRGSSLGSRRFGALKDALCFCE